MGYSFRDRKAPREDQQTRIRYNIKISIVMKYIICIDFKYLFVFVQKGKETRIILKCLAYLINLSVTEISYVSEEIQSQQGTTHLHSIYSINNLDNGEIEET
jgi:hypothetical protein